MLRFFFSLQFLCTEIKIGCDLAVINSFPVFTLVSTGLEPSSSSLVYILVEIVIIRLSRNFVTIFPSSSSVRSNRSFSYLPTQLLVVD